MSRNKLIVYALLTWQLLIVLVQSQIIYSDSFNDCTVDLNAAEMLCTVDGETVLWTIVRPKQNRVGIEDNTLVVRNKQSQGETLVSTLIPVEGFDKVLLELQIVSRPGSDQNAPLAVEKCQVFFDDVLQIGQREDNTDSFVFPEYTPLSGTVKLTVSNDKDESAGSCEFDELIFRAAGDFPQDPPEVNSTGELNDQEDLVPIVAPIVAVFAFLIGVAAIFMVYKQRKMMDEHECTDLESDNTKSQSKSTSDVKERRGGVRIRRNLEEDVIEKPRSQKQEVQRHHLNATGQEEGLSTIRRLQLRKAQSSEETEEESEDTQEGNPQETRESAPHLGPTVSYLKRIQNEAHKSIFRPSSKYLTRTTNYKSPIPPKPPRRPPARNSDLKPTESIDNDIEV